MSSGSMAHAAIRPTAWTSGADASARVAMNATTPVA